MLEHTNLPVEPLDKYRRVRDDTKELAEMEGNENRDLWKNMAHEYCKKVGHLSIERFAYLFGMLIISMHVSVRAPYF